MKRAALLLVLAASIAGGLGAQAVPDGSSAARIGRGYVRTPFLQFDPFRHVMIPHWGLVISAGASAGNNTINLQDLGALIVIDREDEILASDLSNLIGLVPLGAGVQGTADGAGGLYLGGPFGSHFSLGLSARGRAYGSFLVDDDVVALFKEGNVERQSFLVGETQGSGLATAEVGGHAVIRLGPIASQDGVRLEVGVGARYLRPVAYARELALFSEQNEVTIGPDTIAAAIGLDLRHTDFDSIPDYFTSSIGSGIATDFLLRLSWPTSGFAIEAMLANVGSVKIRNVEFETLRFNIGTTSLEEFSDSVDAVDFVSDSVAEVKVSLPRILRFTASAWANRILQLDASASFPAGGDFEMPLTVGLASTWRFVNALPLRAGLVLGGHHGIGYTAGFGVETRSFYLEVMGGSYGGLFKEATGVGGLFELGVFF